MAVRISNEDRVSKYSSRGLAILKKHKKTAHCAQKLLDDICSLCM